jgi:tRNA dimethylallyltransferase
VQRLSAASAPVLVLTGPTGAGKSDWALRLAAEWPLEIVSVDSALVYRGMDIGTAKPTREVRARVSHHLIDILDPLESYSAGQFVTDVGRLLPEIRARGRIPMLVGGTMLYLRALLSGIAPLPRGSTALRRSIDERAGRDGWPALHAELERLDPSAAARIHPNDPQRIQRALEVCYLAGQPLSDLQRATASSLAERTLRFALVPERSVLHERIERRCAAMMTQGFLDEVAQLRARGDLTARHPAMRAVGYRQLWAHLAGEATLNEAVQQIVAATRQLAKRQLTWLRSDRQLKWIDPQASDVYDSFKQDLERELSRA